MIDLHYTHPDLVMLYDLFNGWSIDRDFYAQLAGPAPMRVLEVGCGTGLIARRIAQAGHDVTGLDPASAMLDFAKAASDGADVTWVCGKLAEYEAEPFDLIYMTGHAFQCMLTDDEIAAFMQAARRLLLPDGRLVFETRNPDFEAWKNWVPEKSKVTKTLPDGRMVTEWHDLDDVTVDRVAFRSIYQFPDKQLVSESVLRFTTHDALGGFVRRAGLRTVESYGDWDKSPVAPDQPEIILVLKTR